MGIVYVTLYQTPYHEPTPDHTATQGTSFTVISRKTTMAELTTTTIVAACLLGFIIINIIAFLIWRNRRMRENEIRMKENPKDYDTEDRQSYDYYGSYQRLNP